MRPRAGRACLAGLLARAAPRAGGAATARQPAPSRCSGCCRLAQVQLVPQSFGILTEAVVSSLMAAFPQARFRLHANVRLLPDASHGRSVGLSGATPTGSARRRASAEVWRRPPTRRTPDRAAKPPWPRCSTTRAAAPTCSAVRWVSKGSTPARVTPGWCRAGREYRQLFESGVPYAIDLSHLNILAEHSGRRDDSVCCKKCWPASAASRCTSATTTAGATGTRSASAALVAATAPVHQPPRGGLLRRQPPQKENRTMSTMDTLDAADYVMSEAGRST